MFILYMTFIYRLYSYNTYIMYTEGKINAHIYIYIYIYMTSSANTQEMFSATHVIDCEVF
jgi:hypothetical protein